MHAPIRFLLLASLAGCGGNAEPSSPPPPPPSPPSPNATVAIGNSSDPYGGTVPAFQPANVAVVRNGTVTWTNTSGVSHTVTFNTAAGAPANIPAHEAGSNGRTFGTAGEFTYYCSIHPTMTGRVSVQ